MTSTTLQKPLSHPPGGVREMLAIAVPMIASNACDTVMTFTDRLFLAKLGPEYMSAAMAGGLTCFTMTTFFVGVLSYCTALVAQYYGARRKDLCAVTVTQALLLGLASYPIILALRPVGHWMFEMSKITPEQLGPQKQFFDILLWGAFIPLARACLSGFFSGIGRTQLVLASSLVAMVVNVAANYVLVFGKFGFPALGIQGSAYGTVLGGTCGVLVMVAAFLWPRITHEFAVRRAFRIEPDVMRKLIKFGLPGGNELFFNLLAFDLLILIFHSRGLEAATAMTVVFNWDMVSFLPLIGVNVGVTSLVGRYMGAGDPDTAHRATMSGLKVAWAYGFLALLLFSTVPEFLVQVFRPENNLEVFERAQPMAVFMLRLVAVYVLADATNLVFSGALRGAGDTLWAMVISVGLHWALVAVVVVLLNVLNLPVEAAWLTLVATIVLFSAVFYLRYRAGAWRNLRIVQPETPAPPPPAATDGLHETPDL